MKYKVGTLFYLKANKNDSIFAFGIVLTEKKHEYFISHSQFLVRWTFCEEDKKTISYQLCSYNALMSFERNKDIYILFTPSSSLSKKNK